MTEQRFGSSRGDSLERGSSLNDQRRLELELRRLRHEASAARLEARAARVELMLQQLQPVSEAAESRQRASLQEIRSLGPLPRDRVASGGRFLDWNAVRVAARLSVTGDGINSPAAPAENTVPIVMPSQSGVSQRHRKSGPAKSATVEPNSGKSPSGKSPSGKSQTGKSQTGKSPSARARPDQSQPARSQPAISPLAEAVDQVALPRSAQRVGGITLEPGQSQQPRRRRPAAWLLSAVAHLILLFVLAAVGLQTQRSRDQVSLRASTNPIDDLSVETFSIEVSEPEVSEAIPEASEPELDPVSDLEVGNFSPLAPSQQPPGPVAGIGGVATSSAVTINATAEATTQFCGVEGGGNHFVYLVDSSGSMGDGFESARRELLRSIDALQSDQRFYVIFFDADSQYMRLSHSQTDEPRSVPATEANKAALKRWAMRIVKDKGRAPYEALRFALQLRPDVIFLLSDGEFPQGIEDLLREENHVENLFGEAQTTSIVHTIGYHSAEGELRMRRIAEQNGGKYRYVPGP